MLSVVALRRRALLVIIASVLAFLLLSSLFDMTRPDVYTSMHGRYAKRSFALPVNSMRINTLFQILKTKEHEYGAALDKLNVMSFSRLVREGSLNSHRFATEIDTHLQVDTLGERVTVRDEYVHFLRNLSEKHSFVQPRTQPVNRIKIVNARERAPAILMSADSKYFNPLLETIENIHVFFPHSPLIIYDIGLTDEMYQTVYKACKQCRIVKFDEDKVYRKTSPHIANLNTYSWKPLIIQEVIDKYDQLIYIDTSIRFKANEIQSVLDVNRQTGILARYIGIYLKCFTDERMFEWFNESPDHYANVLTLEANFIMLKRSFLTSLIMKAWVTCALDADCIAPRGAHIYGSVRNWMHGCSEASCGCHRFDQDAISIISSFFFGFPNERRYAPALALTPSENFFFSVERRDVKKYISDQIKNLF